MRRRSCFLIKTYKNIYAPDMSLTVILEATRVIRIIQDHKGYAMGMIIILLVTSTAVERRRFDPPVDRIFLT